MSDRDAKAIGRTPAGSLLVLSLIGASLAALGMWYALDRAFTSAWGGMLIGVILTTFSLMWLQWVRSDMGAQA